MKSICRAIIIAVISGLIIALLVGVVHNFLMVQRDDARITSLETQIDSIEDALFGHHHEHKR